MNRISKRQFTLLEVMIAFALIVLCIIPLIYPHVFILKTQRDFIKKIAVDHIVNLHYADLVEKMYKNEIPWDEIMQEAPIPIGKDKIKQLMGEGSFPYEGSYRFIEIKHKPNEEAPKMVYLMNLKYQFIKKEEILTYDYEVVLVKNQNLLSDVEEEEKEEEKGNEEEE